ARLINRRTSAYCKRHIRFLIASSESASVKIPLQLGRRKSTEDFCVEGTKFHACRMKGGPGNSMGVCASERIDSEDTRLVIHSTRLSMLSDPLDSRIRLIRTFQACFHFAKIMPPAGRSPTVEQSCKLQTGISTAGCFTLWDCV